MTEKTFTEYLNEIGISIEVYEELDTSLKNELKMDYLEEVGRL